MSAPQPPQGPQYGEPERTQAMPPGSPQQPADDSAERTQVVRPSDSPLGQGPDRTQVVRPTQPPQGPPSGGFNPNPQGPPQGGYGPPQGGPPQGGFSPNPQAPPQGGFGPPQGGPSQGGGFNPNAGGPPQGGFGPPQQGFGPPQGGYQQQGGGAPGFGPAASGSDKMVAWGAGGTAILFGLIILIINLSNIGFVFDVSALLGMLGLLLVVVGAGLAGGGVLIFMRNKLGPILGFYSGVGYGVIALIVTIWVSSETGIFYSGGLVGMLLVAVPTVLCFLPQTRRYASGGSGQLPGGLQLPGQGQQGPGPQQGGYGRPF